MPRRPSPKHQTETAVRALAALGLVALLATAGRADEARFPRPDRPVAPIIAAEYSDEKTRDGHGEAERVMDRLDIKAGARVADIGAGSGYYVIRLARRVGASGKVFAEDVNAKYQKALGERLARENVAGVTLILGTANDPSLPPASVDVALLSHMYHEIENPFEFLYRLVPALAPGAKVGIIDVDKPTQDHGTPPVLLRCELAALGYREVELTPLAPADGYLAVFLPPETRPAPESIKPCRQ